MREIETAEIKAVASDLDGTLIREGTNVLPDSFFDTIRQIQAKGIPFVAASGRQYANMRRLLAPIADEIDYISENGCLITHKGSLIHQNAIPKDLALALIDDLLQVPGTEIMISGVTTGYCVSKNRNYIHLLRNIIGIDVKEVETAKDISEDIVKISILWEKGIPREPERYFHEKYDHRLLIANGGNGWLDFNNHGSGKGPALKVIADYYGLSTEEFVVFGDNENDITMLQEAGVSYAVASASDHVKAHADRVCTDVLQVLSGMFLNF